MCEFDRVLVAMMHQAEIRPSLKFVGSTLWGCPMHGYFYTHTHTPLHKDMLLLERLYS